MPKTPFLFALAAAATLVLPACKSANDPAAAVSDPYASNFNDGHYNPYPGQSSNQTADNSPPKYETPPAPEPPSNPYSFAAPKKPVASTSSSSAKPKSTTTKSKPKSTASKSKSKAKSSSGSKITIAKGDTLYGIALKKKTTVAKIKAANGLTSDLIRPGQTLKIP